MGDRSSNDQGLTLKPWIMKHVQEGDYGLDWGDEEKTMIKIPWPMKNQADCEKDLRVCVEWAKHKNKYCVPPDYSKMKARFRSAMDKSSYFCYMENYSKTNMQFENYRVYKVCNPIENKNTSDHSKKKKKRPHPHSEEHPSQNNSIEAPEQKTPNSNCSASDLDKSYNEESNVWEENLRGNQLVVKQSPVLTSTSQADEMSSLELQLDLLLQDDTSHQPVSQIEEKMEPITCTSFQPYYGIASSQYFDIPVTSDTHTFTFPADNLFVADCDGNFSTASNSQLADHELIDNDQIFRESSIVPTCNPPMFTNKRLEYSYNYNAGLDSQANGNVVTEQCLYNPLPIFLENSDNARADSNGPRNNIEQDPCNNLHGNADVSEVTPSQPLNPALQDLFTECNLSRTDLYAFKMAIHYKENKDFDHYEEYDCDLSKGLRVLHVDGPNSDGNCCVLRIPDNNDKKPRLILQILQAFTKGIQFEIDENFVLFGTRLSRCQIFTFENDTVNSPSVEMKKKEKRKLFSYADFIYDLLMYRANIGAPKPGCAVEIVVGTKPVASSSNCLLRLTLTPQVATVLEEKFGKSDSLPELAISGPESSDKSSSQLPSEIMDILISLRNDIWS